MIAMAAPRLSTRAALLGALLALALLAPAAAQGGSSSQGPARPAFGQAGLHYLAGELHLYRNGDDDVYLWYETEDLAAEVIADSNGWWRLHAEGEEYTVFSSGDREEASFYERPWTEALPPRIVEGSLSFEVSGSEGRTAFELDGPGRSLRVSLADGGLLTFSTEAPRLSFADYEGELSEYPGAPAEEEEPGQAGFHYLIGAQLHLYRDRGGDVYLWYGSGKLAVELIADSNGWWRILSGGKGYAIFPSTPSKSAQDFYERPWEEPLPEAEPVEAELSFPVEGSEGQTRFELSEDSVEILLPDGLTKLSLSAREQKVVMVNEYGKRFAYPADLRKTEGN